MDNSPLKFLDYDVGHKLNEHVRLAKENKEREYYCKLYEEFHGGELSYYEHYEKDFLPEQYDLVIKLINSFQSRWTLNVTIENEGTLLSFNNISEQNPQSNNIVKTIIDNYEMSVDEYDDECDFINNCRGIHENCGNINYYDLIFRIGIKWESREHDCMCKKCRTDRHN